MIMNRAIKSKNKKNHDFVKHIQILFDGVS